MFDIEYGADLEPGNEDKPVDLIVGNLIDEILARQEDMAEHQAHIENFPLGNEYEPDQENQFNGMEMLRDISRNNYAKVMLTRCRLNAVSRAFALASKLTKKAIASLSSCSTATTWVLLFRTR